jgi:hypothetical protein
MSTSAVIGDVLNLRIAKIAKRTAAATYDTPRTLYGMVSLRADARLVNAIREGDGKELAAITRVVGANINLEFAQNNLQVLADLLGLSYSIANTTPNRVGTLKVQSKSLPYFGFVAGLDDDNALENAFHIWVPRLKIVGDTIQLTQGSGNLSPQFGNATIECRAFFDPAYIEGQASEVQSVDITGTPTGGTFTLAFGSDVTGDIAYDADASAVEDALEALNNIGSGNVTVTGSNPNFTVTFGGDLANAKLPLLVGDETDLTGGTPGFTIARDTVGSPGEDFAMSLYEDEQGTTPLLPPAL